MSFVLACEAIGNFNTHAKIVGITGAVKKMDGVANDIGVPKAATNNTNTRIVAITGVVDDE